MSQAEREGVLRFRGQLTSPALRIGGFRTSVLLQLPLNGK